MKTVCLNIARKLAIDRAVAFTLLGRLWMTAASLISIIVMAHFLTKQEQGIYYTFASILAVQLFFELGLSYVIGQIASHERAHLEWSTNGTLEGDAVTKSRLSSLFQMSVKWYGMIALLVLLVVLPGGFYFFSKQADKMAHVNWMLPWIWMATTAALNLAITPVFSLLEGCGLVADVALVKTCQAIAGNFVMWLVLFLKCGLFAAPAMNTTIFLVGAVWLAVRKLGFLSDLKNSSKDGPRMSWKYDVWPFQWRIALSTASGFFVMQLFNIVLFAYRGPVEAGQMGMSLSVMTGLMSIGMCWINTKSVPFGIAVARKQYKELDRMFFKSFIMSFLIVAFGGIVVWAGLWYLNRIGYPLSKRMLGTLPFGLLTLTIIISQISYAEAVYLRAHKKDPFLIPSVLSGLLIGASTFFFGRVYGATGILWGYLIITTLMGPVVGTFIFIKKRREWHIVDQLDLLYVE